MMSDKQRVLASNNAFCFSVPLFYNHSHIALLFEFLNPNREVIF